MSSEQVDNSAAVTAAERRQRHFCNVAVNDWSLPVSKKLLNQFSSMFVFIIIFKDIILAFHWKKFVVNYPPFLRVGNVE